MTATAFLHYHGRTKKSLLKSESKLIVRKRQDGSWVAIIGTYIYDKNTEGQEEAVKKLPAQLLRNRLQRIFHHFPPERGIVVRA